MPAGTLSNALTLVAPSMTVDGSLTYFFATTMPSYFIGKDSRYLSSASGPAYYYSAADMVDVGTTPNLATASAAFARLEAVSNATFTTASGPSADMVILGVSVPLYDSGGGSPYGFTHFPNEPDDRKYDMVLMPDGQSDFEATFVHEVMHALGVLDADSVLPGSEQSAQFTVMSRWGHPAYGGRFATELQLYDIAVIQYLHGRDDSYEAGDTLINIFSESSGPHVGEDRIFSIWDGGGTDTIDAHSLTTAVLMDLRPGYFSSSALIQR